MGSEAQSGSGSGGSGGQIRGLIQQRAHRGRLQVKGCGPSRSLLINSCVGAGCLSCTRLILLSDASDCSAGVGRTGCFIVIDAMLERIKHEKTVDIYGHVTLMRAQRNYMVQTEDQYVFIHDALLEAVNCGTTEVPARNLYAYIQKLTQIEGGENVSGMELEFKVSVR